MNVEFYNAHIETLKELLEIAEKHNCTIHFGTRSNQSLDIDEEIMKMCGATQKQIEKLTSWNSGISISDSITRSDEVWFELYDRTNDKYHVMTYSELSCYFWLEKDFDFDEVNGGSHWLDKFLEEFEFSDISHGDRHFISFSSSPTFITGFRYKTRHKDYRVYRPGMALKYFGDLVCDYLKEPRIVRSY